MFVGDCFLSERYGMYYFRTFFHSLEWRSLLWQKWVIPHQTFVLFLPGTQWGCLSQPPWQLGGNGPQASPDCPVGSITQKHWSLCPGGAGVTRQKDPAVLNDCLEQIPPLPSFLLPLSHQFTFNCGMGAKSTDVNGLFQQSPVVG